MDRLRAELAKTIVGQTKMLSRLLVADSPRPIIRVEAKTPSEDVFMPISKETFEKLARFDTPTICNVIELFDFRPRNTGFMDGRIRADFPELPPMVGLASTAAFRSGPPPVSGDAYGSFIEQVKRFDELPGPPVRVTVTIAPILTWLTETSRVAGADSSMLNWPRRAAAGFPAF